MATAAFLNIYVDRYTVHYTKTLLSHHLTVVYRFVVLFDIPDQLYHLIIPPWLSYIFIFYSEIEIAQT